MRFTTREAALHAAVLMHEKYGDSWRVFTISGDRERGPFAFERVPVSYRCLDHGEDFDEGEQCSRCAEKGDRLMHAMAPPDTTPDLTPGEFAAVERLAQGESQAEAAAALRTSRKTVEKQIASARRRWDCRTTAQLLFEFGRRGP